MSKDKDQKPAASPTTLSETVRNAQGEFGDRIIRAQANLRARARSQGLVVKTFTRTPAKVVGEERVEVGKNEDGSAIMHTHKVCEITVTAHLAPAGPERWVRLTTPTGPAAVEVLETEGGQIKKRYEYHPEDVRNISWGFAETALTEMAGP
jgi:hypothetical protein